MKGWCLKIEMSYPYDNTIQQFIEAVGEDYLALRECHYDKKFLKTFRKLKKPERRDLSTRIRYALEFPERGKPMSYGRFGQFEAYVGSSRFYYEFNKRENTFVFREFSHKNYQWFLFYSFLLFLLFFILFFIILIFYYLGCGLMICSLLSPLISATSSMFSFSANFLAKFSLSSFAFSFC